MSSALSLFASPAAYRRILVLPIRVAVISRRVLHSVVDGVISDHREQTTGHDDLLAPYFVGKRSKNGKEGHAEEHGECHDDKASAQTHLQNRLEIEQCVVLACVPDHALSRRRPQQ